MKDEFDTRIRLLPYDLVCSLQKTHRSVELNNVLDGFESDFFTIMLDEDENLDEYSLIYIGSDNEIHGLTFKSGRNIKDRDVYTFRFCQAIESEFPNKNSLVIFNTFQTQLKRVYENFGIICIPEHIAELKGDLTFFMPNKNKKDVDRILQIDFLEFYRSYFNRKNKKIDIDGLEKVYIMYDQKEGFFKIGETKNKLKIRRKGVSEATLRATNPMIEVISAWEASKELETELHLIYDSKRKRGEWFDLRAIDLEDINEMTLKYNMIDITNNESQQRV